MDKQPKQNKTGKKPVSKNSKETKPPKNNGERRPAGRGAAIRAQKRSIEDANKLLDRYAAAIQEIQQKKPRANKLDIDETDKLKITFLGGQDGIGEKNMQVIEWKNDAVILDCGNNLGLNLPGVNYSIADPAYLEKIRHKIKAYIISHGHLDHLGGLKHVVPLFPAPIYGSRFTIGVVEKSFEEMESTLEEGFELRTVIMNMDNHERLKIGVFTLELVRITHSVPESSSIVLDTPVGRIINTGDFRLDPEPLDHMPSDVARLRELGEQGVLALMSESTYSNVEGRQLTEHTLQQSFNEVIGSAEGRVFVAIFSSNMNRVQMIINSAVESGRRVALDGRSMMSYAEIAVRQGILKVPKGTVLSMSEMPKIPEDQVLVICTGGQGEPNAALQRMAEGNHKHVNLKPQDTVIVSSTPIPGNEIRYQEIGNELVLQGVHLFRQPTHEIDGCGPLHVGGHARRDEHREMMQLIQPKFFIPIYAGAQNRRYHAEIAIEEGWPRDNVILANNGDSIFMDTDKWEMGAQQVPHGSLLVNQNGMIVSSVVVKDRVMLSNEGLVAVVLTIDKKTGQLITSPDIISRGFIYMKNEEELMNAFRIELKRAVSQRFKRIDLDRFKLELKDHVTHFLYEQTGRSPIVIPVVNVIGARTNANSKGGNGKQQKASTSPEQQAAEMQKRFAEMRSRLLN